MSINWQMAAAVAVGVILAGIFMAFVMPKLQAAVGHFEVD